VRALLARRLVIGLRTGSAAHAGRLVPGMNHRVTLWVPTGAEGRNLAFRPSPSQRPYVRNLPQFPSMHQVVES
jgi:hypothetical protein